MVPLETTVPDSDGLKQHAAVSPQEDLAFRVAALEQEVREIRARLERANVRSVPGPEGISPSAPAIVPTVLAPGTLALVGRTLVALAGGYLVRAATDAETLPPRAGVALGLAYALWWLFPAYRAAAAGERASGGFHALTAFVIAYPLLWEATARFQLLPPAVGQAALVLVFAAGTGVASRGRLTAAAWANAVLGLGAAAGLLVATHHLAAAAFAFVAMAAIVEGLAFRGFWPALRWPAALVLDGALLVTVWLVSRPEGLPEGYAATSIATALAAILALPALYLVVVVARTLGRGWPVGVFEVAQGTIAVALAFDGAARLLASPGAPSRWPGASAFLLGALAYAAAFVFVERRQGHARNFYFFSTAGAALILLGSRSVLPPDLRSLSWCLLALGAAGFGRRFDRMTLRFHCVLYLFAAALDSGMVIASWRNLLGGLTTGSPMPSLSGWAVAAASLGAYAILATGASPQSAGRSRLAQVLAAAVTAWCLSGILMMLLLRTVGTTPSAAAVAAVRTTVLSTLALGLAWAARARSCRELASLVYPFLVLGGAKLVMEDFRVGRPATLVLSLALYGSALIAAPALLRRPD